MDLIDLSHRLDSSTQAYPGDPVFSSCPALTIGKDGCNVAALALGSHTGTHVDAPFHFCADGSRVDALPLSQLVGPAVVVDLTHKRAREAIGVDDLREALDGAAGARILLLHTGWDRYWSSPEYHNHPHLTRAAAEAVVHAGYRVVGIDAFSPDPTAPANGSADTSDTSDDFPAHHVLLGAGCAIAENLTNLGGLLSGKWCVNLAPLKVGDGDGAPVRAFAWKLTV
jgi:kynurenine formamidase